LDLEFWVRRLAGDLFAQPAVVQAFGRRLAAMSEWFLLAGEESWSRLALAVARSMRRENAPEHPFLLALIRRDLELVVRSLEQSSGSILSREVR
jgi:hypothetical protein